MKIMFDPYEPTTYQLKIRILELEERVEKLEQLIQEINIERNR